MNDKQATVKAHVLADEAVGETPRPKSSQTAESIRLDLAEAWGEMGAAWGVTPAIARVQAYLMARQVPLTEREVREALGLSHRAASLALAEAESWGIVERVPEPRRVGRLFTPRPDSAIVLIPGGSGAAVLHRLPARPRLHLPENVRARAMAGTAADRARHLSALHP